jgi:hypothetical protein
METSNLTQFDHVFKNIIVMNAEMSSAIDGICRLLQVIV